MQDGKGQGSLGTCPALLIALPTPYCLGAPTRAWTAALSLSLVGSATSSHVGLSVGHVHGAAALGTGLECVWTSIRLACDLSPPAVLPAG